METIKTISTVCGAVTAITAIIAVLCKAVRKVIKWFTELKVQLDTIERHERENFMSILRLSIISEEMPIDERLAAGKRYVDLGGNGAIKARYNALSNAYTAKARKDFEGSAKK